ncbi:UDP-2,4-diacetamido-2,4,6-trideoxy-beta-L-altropyranose hydrolase [Candidatus Margulisiibacteriota bacterium]
MRVIIRADSSPNIGGGHIMRCLALAQEFQVRGHVVIFMVKEYFDYQLERLKEEGFMVETVQPKNLEDDAKCLVKFAVDNECNWVILDGYHFVEKYQRIVKDAGLKLLCIDDISDTKFVSDIVVNQNPFAQGADYDTNGASLLMGSDYALLRDEFLVLDGLEHQDPPRRIMISLGAGAVKADYVIEIIKALNQPIVKRLDITIVGGMNNATELNDVKALSNDSPNHNIRIIGPDSFKPEMICESDMAISAAGSTLWELALFGIPTICFVLAKNQKPIADFLAMNNMCFNLGWIKDVEFKEISRAFDRYYFNKDLREGMALKFSKLVDGRGRKRIVQEMLKGMNS